MTVLKEHDRVILATDVSTEGLAAADVGTVVHAYGGDQAYKAEFFALKGKTAVVIILGASELHPVSKREIMHVRELVKRGQQHGDSILS